MATAEVRVSLRPLTQDDLPQVLKIEKQNYPLPWSEENFLKEMEKPYSVNWVLTDDETDETVYGYCTFWILGEEATLLNLSVNPEFKKQGYGTMMLKRVISHALKEEADKLILDVRENNEVAIQLYQANGFTIVSLRKNFYQNGDSAYHMELNFKENPYSF